MLPICIHCLVRIPVRPEQTWYICTEHPERIGYEIEHSVRISVTDLPAVTVHQPRGLRVECFTRSVPYTTPCQVSSARGGRRVGSGGRGGWGQGGGMWGMREVEVVGEVVCPGGSAFNRSTAPSWATTRLIG